MNSNVVFDDLFSIEVIDKDGKKFDRVSRLAARSSNHSMHLTLDYNSEIFPLTADQSFSLALATSLGAPGAEDETHTWRPDGRGGQGLEAEYDYVMYGKVYKFDEGAGEIVTAYASFGGLLMALTGSFRHMQGIVLGEPIYLLIRT
ncbi:RNA polymerase [Exidia glandulosa HHB12029]|uniref:DNA-directed RNA polymerases I, II, and III subunit RPABC3 n=1 Tax=Exidia glandulosa HHB12029 TaxID=1314781 RepID=A0A165GH25_EXIGL|nr:RNA polymerase [Exidia glandulosa HHB12029]